MPNPHLGLKLTPHGWNLIVKEDNRGISMETRTESFTQVQRSELLEDGAVESCYPPDLTCVNTLVTWNGISFLVCFNSYELFSFLAFLLA